MGIRKIFNNNNKPLFIPYITAGYPTLNALPNIIKILTRNNASIIEIGIPFSDPIADGPTIQKTSSISLKTGFKIDKLFSNICKNHLHKINNLVIMTYFNPVYRYDIDKFFYNCKKANIKGLIIPDMSIEHFDDIKKYYNKYGIDNIMLITPNTKLDRIKFIDSQTTGFIYYVSVLGVTGARKKLPIDTIKKLKKIKRNINNPLAIGFGISNNEQITQLSQYIDGYIVGSAILKQIENKNYTKKLDIFLKQLVC